MMPVLMSAMTMLYLLTALIKTFIASAPVTVGNGLWCDYPVTAINQVLSEQQQVAITSNVIWPPLHIKQSLSLTGGYDSCFSAKAQLSTASVSRISGQQRSSAIIIETDHLAVVNLSNLVIENGVAQEGAGLHAKGSYQLHLNQLLVRHNHATNQGGGMAFSGEGSLIHIAHSKIVHNSAIRGAGVAVLGNSNKLTINESMVSKNSGSQFGAGLFCQGVHLIELIDSSITNNTAPWGDQLFKDISCQINSKTQTPAFSYSALK